MSKNLTTPMDPHTVINAAKAAILSYLKGQRGAVCFCDDDINEVVQRVCLKVYTRAHTYDPKRGGISTWVGTMTATTIYDFLKERSYRGRWAEGYNLASYHGGYAKSPSEEYELNEAIGFVGEYESGLNSQKKQIFGLMKQEYRNKEIAQECGLSENAVNASIHRMRKELKEISSTLYHISMYPQLDCAC